MQNDVCTVYHIDSSYRIEIRGINHIWGLVELIQPFLKETNFRGKPQILLASSRVPLLLVFP